jgi:hypothetical protein
LWGRRITVMSGKWSWTMVAVPSVDALSTTITGAPNAVR